MIEDSEPSGRGRRWPKAIVPVASATLVDLLDERTGPDDIYQTLRRMILYNELPPGAWLRQQDLARQFQTSRTPVREALRTLSQEGLVHLVPNHGARVTSLTIEEFEEIYALRSGIEGLAARLTAQLVRPPQLSELRARLDGLEAQMHSIPLATYLHEEWQFRLRSYEYTGRARLLTQVVYLREHSERYIHLAYTRAARIDESFAAHRQLLAAYAAGDGGQAEVILQAALRATLTHAGPLVREQVAAR